MSDKPTPEVIKAATVLATNLVKRYGASHKMSVAKVAHHLDLAKAAHAKGMASLAKAAGCMVEAHKLGKAATPDVLMKAAGDAAGHMASAHKHFSAAGDHMEDMEAHLGKAMSAWGHDTQVSEDDEVGGEITIPGLRELTEGEVPWYDSESPYAGHEGADEPYKAAKSGKKIKKLLQEMLTGGKLVPAEQVEKMVKEATEKAAATAKAEALAGQVDSLTKTVEMLQRMPAGSPKVKIFDFDKSNLPGMTGGNDDKSKLRLGALLEGINTDIRDEGDFTKAAGGMIANMIKHGPKFEPQDPLFGKPPMWDPHFHGRGGTGAR